MSRYFTSLCWFFFLLLVGYALIWYISFEAAILYLLAHIGGDVAALLDNDDD